MAQKARVSSSFRNGNGTLLRRSEGGFTTANLSPLISRFLVRYGEGTLRCGEVFQCGEGGFAAANP